MTLMTTLRASGILARKGEALPSLERAAFSDPSLSWGNEAPAAPPVLAPTLVWPRPERQPRPPAKPRLLPGARQPFTARLPVDLHRRLKAQATDSGRTMTSLVAEALERVLADQAE